MRLALRRRSSSRWTSIVRAGRSRWSGRRAPASRRCCGRSPAGWTPIAGRIAIGRRRGVRRRGEPRRPRGRRPGAVGLVFQDYALFPHLSVRANVAFGPRSRGLRTAAALARADAWLERLGIESLADAPARGRCPAASASGSRWRGRSPPSRGCLLLDEPLSALDAVTKAGVAAELARSSGRPRLPAVLVSHDFADVVGLAERIAVIGARTDRAGRRRQAELLETPASPFVAGVHRRQLLRRDRRRGEAS